MVVRSLPVRLWPIAVSVATIVASGCSSNVESPRDAALAAAPVVVAGQTVADVPSVTDPALYLETCSQLRQTQDVTGVHAGSPDTVLRGFIASQQQASWWDSLDVGRHDTYVRAVRDFAAGKC